MRLLRTSLIAFSFAACESMPVRPDLEIGQLDLPRSEVIYGRTVGENPDPLPRRPLSDYDKATCFMPKEWEKAENYKDSLEIYIARKCKCEGDE